MGIKNPLEVLDTVLRASPLAIIVIDGNGLVRRWNPSAERILGWSAEETIGRPVPVDSQLLFSVEGAAEVRLYRKDGVPIDVEIRTGFWPEQNGHGTVAIFSETGLHRAAEQRLFNIEQELERVSAQEKLARGEARIERRFRELLEAAPDAIIEVDREGRIVLLNLVTEKMFGYKREDLLGKPVELWCRRRFGVPMSVTARVTGIIRQRGRWAAACRSKDAARTARAFRWRSA